MNIKYSGIRWIHVLLNFTLYRITNKSFHLNIHNSKKACKHDITFVIFFTYLFTSTLYRVQLLDTSFCSFVCHVFTIDCQDCFVPEFRFHVSSNNLGETYVAVLRSTTQNYCCQILFKTTCTQNYAINKLVELFWGKTGNIYIDFQPKLDMTHTVANWFTSFRWIVKSCSF